MTSRQQRLKVIEGTSQEHQAHAGRPVAVVTGAARGIGRALVDELKSRGYLVVAVVRNLADVRELFMLDPQNILPVRCDVSEASTEKVLREFLETQTGKVDLLINNAGFGATAYGIDGLNYKELDDLLAVHCYGPIRCVRACLPFLRESSRAAVVNISSRFGSLEWVATGTVPCDQATYPYRIAKAAMNMFTSCLAVELRSQGIRVLAVDPGKVKTRFGPADADTEPIEAARAIVDLVERGSDTGLFLHASGEKLPW
ncbi:MAG TPA: SDR family NAD(P)-dependent oxidoreductase [Candidatus Obscuribacterales bacterium]